MNSKKKRVLAGVLAFMTICGTFALIPATVHAETTDNADAESGELEDLASIVSNLTSEDDLSLQVRYISSRAGDNIDADVEETAALNEASRYDGIVSVTSRDWDKYSSDYVCSRMTTAEKTFYDRVLEVANSYMNDSALDAVYYSQFSTYVTNGIKFDDLGMTSNDAANVVLWFIYNNPQYYFLRTATLVSSTHIYIGCYDVFADGDDRATETNRMFDIIDNYITTITDDEITIYQTEMSAHDLVLDTLSYVSNDYSQSLYSAVELKETVCAGYSELFNVLMNGAGADSVVGFSDSHAWNTILLSDNNWYGVDTTWDDTGSDCKAFINCSDANLKRMDTYKNEHTYDAISTKWAPTLASSDYVPTNYDLTGIRDNEVVVDSPSNLIITQTWADGRWTATWTGVDNADHYEIEVYDGDVSVGTATASATTFTNETTWNYSNDLVVKIRAVAVIDGQSYYSDWSQIAYDMSAKPTLPAPTSIDCMYVETWVNIIWTQVKDAFCYEVEFYTDSAYTNKVYSDTVSECAISVSDIEPFTTYYVRVRAVCPLIDGTSIKSDWITSSFTSGSVSVAEPTGLRCEPDVNSLKFSWGSVSGAGSYYIELYSDSTYNNKVGYMSTISPSATFVGLDADTTYYARVRSVAVNNSKVVSDWVTTTAQTLDFVQPIIQVSVPENIRMESSTKTSVTIAWDEVYGASKYSVKLYGSSQFAGVYTCSGKVIGSADTTSTSVTITSSELEPGTPVYFCVKAIGEDTESDWSGLVEATLYNIATPSNLSVSNITHSSADLSWTGSPETDKYEIKVYSLISTSDDPHYAMSTSSPIQTVYVTDANIHLDNLPDDSYTWVYITAIDEDGGYTSSYASKCFHTDIADVNTKPTGLKTTLNGSKLRVEWNAVTTSSTGTPLSTPAMYKLEAFSDAAYTDRLDVCEWTNVNYCDIILNSDILSHVNDKLYIRVLSSRNYSSDITSDWAYITVDVSGLTQPDTPVSIAAPTNLSVTRRSTSAKVTWGAVSGAEKYNIKICNDAAGNSKIISLNTRGTAVTVNNVKAGTTKYVFVRAYDADTNVYSDWVSADLVNPSSTPTNPVNPNPPVDPVDPTDPDKPVDEAFGTPSYFNAVKLSSKSYNLIWGSVSGAASYRLEIYSDPSYTRKIVTKNTTKTSIKLSSSARTAYYVRVCAIDSSGNMSGWINTTAVFG